MSKNILILSTGDNHGAYEAAYKLAKFLFEKKYQVALVVTQKTKNDPFITQVTKQQRQAPHVKQTLIVRLFKRLMREYGLKEKARPEKESFTTDENYLFLTKDENEELIDADAIVASISFVPDLIISGMTYNFCTSNTLAQLHQKTGAKVYTWLVDMEPLTGGCHYAWDCKGYEQECKNCPAILEEALKGKAHLNFSVKQANIQKAGIKVLSGSQWVTEQALNSTLFKSQNRILTTNACIDTRIMNAKNRGVAKQIFGIPDDAKVIFTGSWNVNDPRKGLKYFLASLNKLSEIIQPALKENIYILIAGEHYGETGFLKEIPFKKLHIDYIKDYRLLSLAYQAADIFVCSSVEDSGPMMVSEAMACGTPVVGFRMGNVYSMVENDLNGYVAELKNSDDLAMGLNKILSLSAEDFQKYSMHAANKIEQVASHHVAVEVIESLFHDN